MQQGSCLGTLGYVPDAFTQCEPERVTTAGGGHSEGAMTSGGSQRYIGTEILVHVAFTCLWRSPILS